MQNKLYLVVMLVCMSLASTAQSLWKPVQLSQMRIAEGNHVIRAKKAQYFELNVNSMKSMLSATPVEQRGGISFKNGLLIALPMPDGSWQQFSIVESSVMEPGLAAQFPEIKSYTGRGIDDPSATLKMDLTYQGFHAMISNPFTTAYVYPYFHNNTQFYQSYYSDDVEEDPVGCGTEDALKNELSNQVEAAAAPSGTQLRTYRAAISATGEYTRFHGGTVAGAQSAIATAINELNAIFEREVSLRLVLISKNADIIYTDPNTDPYSGGVFSGNLDQAGTNIPNVIGNANFDIGHLFTVGGGGVANLGVLCTNSKSRGVSSTSSPVGPGFIGLTAHEMGHQLSGGHSFSGSVGNCGPGNQMPNSAYEVGSGSSIMSYAGICGSDNLGGGRFLHYYTTSYDEIVRHTTSGSGNNCPVKTPTNNNFPIVTVGTGGFTIPISTPFTLKGSATDSDGDALTYCWEQVDRATSFGLNNQNSTTGPMFRGFAPIASSVRTFPRIANVIANNLTDFREVVPAVSRNFKFRLTARDNRAGGGGVNNAELSFATTSAAGPFLVTSPNSSLTWSANSTQTVTWNVANTTAAPVSCQNVKITLSTDGGNTYPIVLIENTPNNGSATITVPGNAATTKARVRVECDFSNYSFFDISNADFTITGGTAPPACGTPTGLSATAITTTGATVRWTAVSGAASYDVDYKIPAAASWTSAGTAITGTSLPITGLTAGTLYNWRVRAKCGTANSEYAQAQFTTQNVVVPPTCAAPTGLNASAVTTTGATLNWTAATGAVSYMVEYKTASATTWTLAGAAITATSTTVTGLTAGTTYNWRIKTNCANTTSDFAQSQFTTQTIVVPPTCASPTKLNTTAVSATGATLNWSAVSGATSYTVEYKTTSATTWTSAGAAITGTSTTVTGLTASTVYDWRVKTNCGNEMSAYTTSKFTTNGVVVPPIGGCPGSADSVENGSFSNAQMIALNTDVKGRINPTGDNDFYKFEVTATGVVTITLTTLPADYDVRIYTASGRLRAIGQRGNTADERLNLRLAPGTYFARIYGWKGANNATQCYTFKVVTGQAQREDEIVDNGLRLQLSPVPTKDVLSIKLDGFKGDADIRMFDINGKLMMQSRVSTDFTKVNVTKYQAGVYVVKVRVGDETRIAKFVKL